MIDETNLIKHLLEYAWTIAMFLFGLVWRRQDKMREELNGINKTVNDNHLLIATDYAKKADVKEVKDEIIAFLIRIENKLDTKADK